MNRFVPVIAITLFALLSAIPLIANQTTCSDDGFFHIAKAVTLEQMIRDGQPFGRWSPEMAHGFGYPYFNYYAPLPSYILIAIHSLGFTYPIALHIFFALCIWIAGLATYFFVRDWMNDAAGVAASVVYMTAPYLAFDILFRSALAESFALIFPPLILFFAHRSLSNIQRPTSNLRLWDFGFALSIAALLYTHNITALITLPLIVGYISLQALIPSKNFTLSAFSLRSLRLNLSILGNELLIIILGLALSARFWLPALTERTLVQSDKLIVPPIFTYYTNYLSLNELLAPPTFIDPLIINPSPAKALGLVTAFLALIGFVAMCRQQLAISHQQSSPSPLHPFTLSFFLIALFVYSSLTLPLSQPLWDSIPLMPFIQFPWRLLGIASLCAAILSGAAVYWLPRRAWLLSGVVITVAVLSNLSWWYPRYCSPFKEVTLADTIQYEVDTFTLGTSAKGEFLPNTVKIFPQDDSFGKAIIRGERQQPLTGLPPTAQLTLANPYPLNYRATISLPEPAQLTFNQFYFPGWYATLDDLPLTVNPHPETGLISLTVPSGAHTLAITFGNTPIRNVGDAVTLIALAVVIAYCVFRIAYSKLQSSTSKVQTPYPQPQDHPVTLSPLHPFIPSPPHPFILFIPIILIILRASTPISLSPFNGETISIGKPINAKLANGLNVLSVEFPSSVESGAEFDIVVYLAPREYTPTEYRPRFDLITPDGFMAINGDEAWVPRWHREPPGTQYWGMGQYAQWARRIKIPDGTPPGDYPLRVNIFNRATLEPNSVVNDEGAFIAPYISLGSIRVTRPSLPATNIKMQYQANHRFGAITLLGYNMDRDSARGGDDVYFTFLFRADPTSNFQLPTSNFQFSLLSFHYPTSEWKQNDVWRFQTKARVPADVDSAQYRFILKSPDSAYELAPIKVIPIQRAFTAPAIQNQTSIRFKDMIELAGYTIKGNQIELIWTALATPDQDLIAFVHVEDSSGKIIAQSDSVPANWSRPTTGWVKGEFIVDTRTLPPLSNGGITLYVGFADRSSGDRFGDRAIIYKLP
jgi:hypothetical protein